MRPTRLALALALGIPPLVLLGPHAPLEGPRPASAAVSILMTLDELVTASQLVMVATPRERRSAWEEVNGGRRIVTHTRLEVEQAVVGTPSAEIWVRTLGGEVGKIGQHVSGEAELRVGEPALLFLAQIEGVHVVTGLAQGHFSVERDAEGRQRVAPGRGAGTLLPRRGPSISAREELAGSTLDAARQAIERARRRTPNAKP